MSKSAFDQINVWVNELANTREGQTERRNTLLTSIELCVYEYRESGVTILSGPEDAIPVKEPTGDFATDCRKLKDWVAEISTDSPLEGNYLEAIEDFAEAMCVRYGGAQKRHECTTIGTASTGEKKRRRSWRSRVSSLVPSGTGSSGYRKI
jgi:hypothetical protein